MAQETNRPISQGNGINNFLVYENSTAGIVILYPANWTKSDHYFNTTVAFFSLQDSIFTITVKELSKNMTLDRYTVEHISELNKTFRHPFTPPITTEFINITESSPTRVGANAAHKLTYQYYAGPDFLKFKATEIYTIINDRLYEMRYYGTFGDGYEKHLNTAQKMIDSFEILHV
jgi:hypothetical protein